MRLNKIMFGAALLCVSFAGAEPAAHSERLRVFYFGNSLTGNTMPQWQSDLGKSAGKEWIAQTWLGAGWTLWMHREGLRKGGTEFSPESQGDLTIDQAFISTRSYHAKAFLTKEWDAIVLQTFGAFLTNVVTDANGGKVKFDRPTDLGEVQSAADIIAFYLKMNPAGRVFLYQVWPPMQAGEARDGKRAAEFPLREQFDYKTQWLQTYVPSDKPWDIGISQYRTRDFNAKVFAALQERYPALWKEGRLRMIPTGDVYLALDEAIRAGKVPGIGSIGDFYTDIQHQRAGLARYTAAAVFYACLFGEHPGKLDWRVYNDLEKYGPDPNNDRGELLEITPERASAVNEVIWETVSKHPWTGLAEAK